MRFAKKVVVVTGGAQGIGKATCIKFASEGANVIVVDIDKEKGVQLKSHLNEMGCEVHFICADMSKEDDIIAMSREINQIYKDVHALVNCAMKGIIKGIEASAEEWQACFMTNVVGYALCIKHCLPMMKDKQATIVNISSISGFIAQPEYLTYSTTKAALINMARCLAMDLAPYGIRVNNVCPGTIWTENNAYYMGRDFGVNHEQADEHPEIGGKHLLNRTGTPEEVANCIFFLSSEESSFVTGENLVVDGGYIAKA